MNEPNIEAAIAHALARLAAELPPELTYHSLEHTRDEVLPAAAELAGLAGLNAQDADLLRVSAAFHDLGYSGGPDGHEMRSAESAARSLPAYGFHAEAIGQVRALILATRMPQSPRNLLEQLLCDADLSGLAAENYLQRGEALLRERRALGAVIRAEAWWREQAEFLSGHRYWTEYARDAYGAGKAQNLRLLRARLAKT